MGSVSLVCVHATPIHNTRHDTAISMHDSILSAAQHQNQNQQHVCEAPGGIWLAEQATCQCCPGYHGTGCAARDRCKGVTCLNGGSCDAKTGQCLCNEAFMGTHCEIPYCGEHGMYDPFAGECTCHRGWGGQWCDRCALPTRTGYIWTCVPGKTSDYILMQLSGDVANQVVQGQINPLAQSYAGIFPVSGDPGGVKGHDGRYYDCACRPVDHVKASRQLRYAIAQRDPNTVVHGTGKRYGWSDLGAFDIVVTDCIADGNLTMQEMDDLNCLWDTCVRQARHGRLNDSWYIVGIIFIVLFIVALVILVMTCFLWSYQLDRVRRAGESSDSAYGGHRRAYSQRQQRGGRGKQRR